MINDRNKIAMSMLSINFLEKLPFKGSDRGMRYMFKKEVVDDEKKLNVYAWKDLFNFESTNEKNILKKQFKFSKEGIMEGLKWLSELQENMALENLH